MNFINRGRILQDLASLRQLDGEDVTKEERRESGFVVSSDEDEDEVDSDKDDENLYDDYMTDTARESLEFFERTGHTADSGELGSQVGWTISIMNRILGYNFLVK